MRSRFGIASIFSVALLAASAWAAVPKPLEPLSFLLGEWRAEGGGAPGQAAGRSTFSLALQDRVLIRTSFAEYPAAEGKSASRHDDLMVIHAEDSGEIRADYYDDEGHVIRYAVAATAGQATFTSDAVAGAPRFRLSYSLTPTGVLSGRFEVAPPGKPDGFSPYLTWTARKGEPEPRR